jgi:hypothetical protein
MEGQTLAACIDAAHAALDEHAANLAAKTAAQNRSARSAHVLPGR